MNQKVLHTLEFDKIIHLLEEQAFSEGGKTLCHELVPSDDINHIIKMQQQTFAALGRIFRCGSISFSGVHSLSFALSRLEVGGALSAAELLRISHLLEAAKRVRAYGATDSTEKKDCLSDLFLAIEPLTPLCDEIRRCILSEDEIADDASSNLRHIRNQMQKMQGRIHSQMNEMLANASTREHLRDHVITMRNGRYCLPVKADAKSLVPGMIHDQSSTGSTLFIEPMAVVKLNNDLKQLSLDEKEEIEKILANLSEQAAAYSTCLAEDYRLLTQLDFIFARGMLAKNMNASRPILKEDAVVRIRGGRHPLLDPKKVVPIDVHLGYDFHQLIITGPNTGGKTVSLKTVGLFCLMAQAGLHIPALDRCEIGIFHEIYADIGDEQSIEQSLSTFSSHMTNIVSILEHANHKSLVLFDELCAGTDPTEGAALAISILDCLRQNHVLTMATTHYSEMKAYALSTEDVENASCEFDVKTLSPTYHLMIGVPGKSNAFAISGKLGLDQNLIDNARERMSQSQIDFENLISDLENSRANARRMELEAQSYKSEIEVLKKRAEEKEQRISTNRDKIIREANEKAQEILSEAKEIADKTIRDFQKYASSNPDIRKMEQQRALVREQMKKSANASTMNSTPKKKKPLPKNLRIGDKVKVLSMNLTGTVHSLPNAKGELTVQMGILNSKVQLNDLEFIEEAIDFQSKTPKTSAGKLKMNKSQAVSTEINLLGKTADEAIALLDKYIDDAVLAHIPSVRIVHGKGTGVLRSAVQKYLKTNRSVASYRLGAFGEGDSGVTIAELK
ncbi:endonuclease MutS2 [Eubacterium oxidoreducens]|uniref:Endonuclease MutS2 n=1 Tax=Eubacterium oxidoreducens TaxID=1732 RepID=A0A1G6CFV7_EUBOX|nr:endonuclease MutS2 [Eubacterium oxidoreducens]SDB31749.1 DNA mismatch repair protein MutS2 [Eubacterium oxidoreducens]